MKQNFIGKGVTYDRSLKRWVVKQDIHYIVEEGTVYREGYGISTKGRYIYSLDEFLRREDIVFNDYKKSGLVKADLEDLVCWGGGGQMLLVPPSVAEEALRQYEELEAERQRVQKEYALKKAAFDPRKEIEGYVALHDAVWAIRDYQEEYARTFDECDEKGIPHPVAPAITEEQVADLERQYPKALAYMQVEDFIGYPVKQDIGLAAEKVFILGGDWEKAVKGMEVAWKKYLDRYDID